MKHTEKVKIARRLRSKTEEKAGVSIWSTQNWLQRKQDRMRRAMLQRDRAHLRRLKRIEAKAMANSPL